MEPTANHLHDDHGEFHYEHAASMDVSRGVQGTAHAALPDFDPYPNP